MVSLFTASLSGLTGLELGDASGLVSLTRQLGGSIGIALLTTILNKRLVFHYGRQPPERVNVVSATLSRFIMLQRFFAGKAAPSSIHPSRAGGTYLIDRSAQAVLLAMRRIALYSSPSPSP